MEMEAARWERHIPRRVVRVLVVEPDVSTRNVISALLRNCNYKVSSVSDGLEAWEVLKEKPGSIDLLLTEVDLPSVSGFTLLSLLMDHDVFKRIPVIMMSSQDSISTVLKCVLKGAADFLIKPIRKNELKNIWQHLWRRQISVAENKHLSTIEEYQKLGGTSENPAVGSSSSARLSSEQEEVECKEMKIIAKTEAEDRMDERRTNSNFDEECVKINQTSADCGREMLGSGTRSLDALWMFDDGAIVKRAKLNDSDSEEPKFQREERIGAFELPGSGRDALFREPISLATIDLLDSIGAGKGESETSKSIVGKSNSACGLQLELWLQGSVPSIARTNEPDGGCLLNHSSASAFSRYNSRNGFGCSLPSYSMIHSTEQRTVNECKEPHLGCRQRQSFLRTSGDDCTAVIDGQSEIVKNTFASSMELVLPRERSRNSNLASECHDPTLDAHSCQTLSWSTSITGMTDKSVIQLSNSGSSELHKCTSADNINAERTIDKRERESDSVMEDYLGPGDVALCSLMHDRTNGSRMCKEINENTVTAKLVDNTAGFSSATALGSKKAICGGPNQADNFHLSAREAALIKFRQKRKERCFEKKVRYHSRKQLAEQRPRVKGQFVRQMQADSASPAS